MRIICHKGCIIAAIVLGMWQVAWAQRGTPIPLSYTNPGSYTIAELTIEGNTLMRSTTLLSFIPLEIGDNIRLPGEDLNSITNKLWEQGLLENLEVRAYEYGEGIEIVFIIEERLRITEIKFKGLRRGQVQEVQKETDKFKRRIVNNLIRQSVVLATQKILKKKGYLNAVATAEVTADPVLKGGAILNVKVRKGQYTSMRSFNFEGTEQVVSSRKLKEQFSELGEQTRINIGQQLFRDFFYAIAHPKQLWRSFFHKAPKPSYQRNVLDELSPYNNINIFKGKKFTYEKYEQGLVAVEAFLQSKGHRNVYVQHDSINFNRSGIDIDLQYDVGRVHYVGDIKWEGNHIYTDSVLTQILGIRTGDIYDPSFVQKRLFADLTQVDITTLYQDQGHLYFRIEPVEARVHRDTVDLEFRIYEGLPAKISAVRIVGNDRTKDHVFLRELYTLPGETFSRTDILQSQQRLNQLGYIDPQETNPVPIPIPERQEVEIEWQVQEKSSDQIELSGGWGGGVGLIGSIGFVLNNFSLRNLFKPSTWNPLPIGDGQQFSIRFRTNGRAFLSFSTSFSEPWLGGRRRNNFSVSYTLSREQYFGTNDLRSGFFVLHGITVGILRSLRIPDDYFSLGYSVTYRNYQLQNASSRSLGFSTGDANNLSFTLTFTRNRIDNPIFPTKGALLSLSATFTPPYSAFSQTDFNTLPTDERYKFVEYHKWIFDAKTYVELVKNLVVETRLHLGAIGTYTNRSAETPFERFTLGGDGITGQNFILGTDVIGLRGYANNSITPFQRNNNITGGRFFTKVTTELRFKVLQTGGGTIYLLSFAEAGNNLNNFREFSFFDSFRSFGFGIRALLPAVGFIGLDWGQALDLLPGQVQRGSQFHFIIGQTIR